jgi:hypothetical protein
MPSNETIHIHTDNGNSIVVLGVMFNNIKHPVDNAGNPIESISGYEILRGSREGNRSIVAKGMFNNMLTFGIQGSPSTTGLMQNYPYNDLRSDPFLNGVNSTDEFFSFHSPETTIVKPYLGAGVYSKIYTEEQGLMKGVYTVPYKHPREKIITDFSFGAATIVAFGIALVSMLGKTSKTTSSTSHQILINHSGRISGSLNSTIAGVTIAGTSIPVAALTVNGPINTQVNETTSDRETGTQAANLDRTQSMTTEGGSATSYSDLVAQLTQSGTTTTANTTSTVQQILAYATAIATGIMYFYQAWDTMLDIIYKLVPYRDYVLQFNSHAFYNSYAQLTNSNVPATVLNKSISRKVSSKYTSSGVQDFNATNRINNTYRNKFVTLNIPGKLPSPNSITDNTKQTANGYGPNVEVLGNTVAYYGALKLDYENQYGQLTSVVQIPTDSCIYKTQPVKNLVNPSTVIFGGDIYINRYTEKNMYAFFNTWAYDLPDDTPFNYELYPNGPIPVYWANFRHYAANDFNISINLASLNMNFVTPSDFHNLDVVGSPTGIRFSVKNQAMYLFNNGVRDFFTESELNMAFRDYGENEWEKFYDVYGNSFNDLNVMFRSDIITRPIYYKYDLSLSTSKLYNNFASWGSILPPDFDPVLYETCYEYFPYRGIYSLQQQDGLKRDNWRNFLPLNYYTFEGVVTNIKSINSSGALILYEDFTPSQFVGVDTLKTEAGTKVTIGDGGLFANNIQSLANAEDVLDYGASISNRATLNTPYGLFYVSQKAGKIIQYGGEGLQEISKLGMKNWFLQNLPSELLKAFPNFTEYDNPVSGIAVQSVYDAQYELLYFTKKDYKPKSNCIGYTPELGFYDKCNCPVVCPAGFTLNSDGVCEKITDTPACNTGFEINPDTGLCEAIERQPSDCSDTPPGPVVNAYPASFKLTSANDGVTIASFMINGVSPSATNATFYELPITGSSGKYEASPPTIDGTTPIGFPNPTAVFLSLNWGPPSGTTPVFYVYKNNILISTITTLTYLTPIFTIYLSGIADGDNIRIEFSGV